MSIDLINESLSNFTVPRERTFLARKESQCSDVFFKYILPRTKHRSECPDYPNKLLNISNIFFFANIIQ